MLLNIFWLGKFDFYGFLRGELVEVVLLKVVIEVKLIDWFYLCSERGIWVV